MSLRGFMAAACAATVSLCPQVNAQLTFPGAQSSGVQRVTRQDVDHERCVRIEFEDSLGVPVETEVTYSKMDGSTGTVAAGGPCELTEVSDLLTLRFKNPLTMQPQQMELDLRGKDSLNLRVCMDEAGNSKVIRVRQGNGALDRQAISDVMAPFVLNGSFSFGLPNDDCENAADIGSADSFEYAYAPIITSTDGPEACHWFGGTQILNDTWFKWTSPCTGIVFATNCGAAIGDSKIAVYDGAGCPDEGTDPLACNDDFCGTFFLDSAVAFDAVEGAEYLFRVGKSPSTEIFVGGGTFSITCVERPENDLCADAIPVSPGSSTFGSTFAATVEQNVPESCPGPFFDVPVDSPGVWYEVIGTGGEMRANICNSELNFLSRLTVYCAEGGCEDLTCVGAVRNQVCIEVDHIGVDPAVNWCSTEGAVYKILVHGALGLSGHFRLDVDDLGECLSDRVPCGDFVEKFGACCDGEHCYQSSEGECLLAGGTFLGDGTDCCGNGMYEVGVFDGVNFPVSGEATPLFNGVVDDGEAYVPLGFCFDFFGQTYDHVTVTSNGLLVFGEDGWNAGIYNNPVTIPDGDAPNNYIAALWADWVVDPTVFPNAQVYVETTGNPGSRQFICEWVDLREFGVGHPESATFQARLNEETGTIRTSWVQFPPAVMPCVRVAGIENAAGTEGYQIDDLEIVAQDRAIYQVPDDPVCETENVELSGFQSLDFSSLDGGHLDADGMVDGVFTVGDLEIHDSQIVVDVPHATFDIAGKLTMTGQGRIDGQTAFMQPVVGPTLCVLACGGVDMQDESRITSRGSEQGGDILVCTERGSVVLDSRAAINASAYNLQVAGTRGGTVTVVAKKTVRLLNYLAHIAADGNAVGGEVDVSACGGFDHAVELFGRLQAVAFALTGSGGNVFAEARKGGAFISTVGTLKTEGGPFGEDGDSIVAVATQVNQPVGGLLDTLIFEGHANPAPCSCGVLDTIDPEVEEEVEDEEDEEFDPQ